MTTPPLEPSPPDAVPIRITLNRTGGRELLMVVPVDMTVSERLELIEWIAGAMAQHLAPPSPIVLHRGPLPPTT